MSLIYLQEHGDKIEALGSPPLLTKMTTCVERRAGSECDADADGTKLIKVLELTEKELFECKVQLKTKVNLFSRLATTIVVNVKYICKP